MARVETLPLQFSNLALLDDGKIDRVLRLHLQRVAQDVMARPGDKVARKVTLEFAITPILDDDGECSVTKVEIEAKSKIPVHRTRPYEMRVGREGFAFNRDFPEELDQAPLFPSDPER